MTKDSLIKLIYDTVAQGLEVNDSKDDIMENLETIISQLEPKNRQSFSQWGRSSETSTPDKCWE